MRLTFRLPAAAIAVACFAARLPAQSDEETLARYRLTEATLAKFTQASRNLVAAVADPTVRREQGEDPGPHTIAEVAAAYDRHPAMQRAITSAGMTTREFTTFVLSMLQAGMGAWIVEREHGRRDKVPIGIPIENVLFYQEHQAELERLTEELRALDPREQAPSDEEQRPGGLRW